MTDQGSNNEGLEAEIEDSVWNSERIQEAQPDVFETGRRSWITGEAESDSPRSEGSMGDSRPDRLAGGSFEGVGDDPNSDTIRDAHEQPEIRKEDPRFLEERRVDQDDEIVGVPNPHNKDQEIAVLRPRETKKGAESEQL